MKKAAIYHFTNESAKRPKIYKDQLKTLEKYAASLGFKVEAIYCDKSLKVCEREEFKKLLSEIDSFDALITKDFYHISKNTMQCINIMNSMRSTGVFIHTIDNGCFVFEKEPFNDPLRVVTYNCRFGTETEMHHIIPLQNDILRLFVEKKTQWSIINQYFDESENQNNGEQVSLDKIIKNKDKYDLLLVHNLNDIHWRTSNFCKIREALGMDIYSLQNGFLKYRRDNI